MFSKKIIKVKRKKMMEEYLKSKRENVVSFEMEQPFVSSSDFVYYMMKYKSKN